MKHRLLLAAAAICAIALISVGTRSTVSPQHMFSSGDCTECHKQPPRYHADNFWSVNHGRTPKSAEARCDSCHPRAACQGCHRLAPATHTSGFRNPGISGRDAERHIMLGRTQPEGCLACHLTPAAECARCHTVNETREWEQAARPKLQKWRKVLE